MLLQRIGNPGNEIPVVSRGGVIRDLRPITPDITPDFIRDNDIFEIEKIFDFLPTIPGAHDFRIGPPIKKPGAVYCVGMNYAKHAAEAGAPPPENLVVFLKPPHTISGPYDDFLMGPGFTKVDWEVELAIVVGKLAWQLKETDSALDFIFGYSLANDLSDRHWQLEISGGQWSKGKSGPGFLPLGPSIVPRHLISPDRIRLQSWVNGQPRQDSSTADMIFSVERILRDMSQFTALQPGDLILTGTPEGVALSGRFPYLSAGDEILISIDGLGSQKQLVVAASSEEKQ